MLQECRTRNIFHESIWTWLLNLSIDSTLMPRTSVHFYTMLFRTYAHCSKFHSEPYNIENKKNRIANIMYVVNWEVCLWMVVYVNYLDKDFMSFVITLNLKAITNHRIKNKKKKTLNGTLVKIYLSLILIIMIIYFLLWIQFI